MKLTIRKLIYIVIALVIIGLFVFFAMERQKGTVVIKTFDDCVRTGRLVTNSVPKRCQISDGMFIVDIAGIERGDYGKRGSCSSYTFDKYTVNEIIRKPVSTDYTSYKDSEARRDVIDTAMKNNPNFAGHYVVASWDCGVRCQESAIINARTGKILVMGINSVYGVETRQDSTLLIVNSQKNIPASSLGEEDKISTVFYSLENEALNFLCRESVL